MGCALGCCAKRTAQIENPEERAMSLKELKALRGTITERCTAEAWVDLLTDAPLKPEEVNLYHLNFYLLSPDTAPLGVILKGLDKGKKYSLGARVVQKDSGFARPRAEGVVQRASRGPDVSVKLLLGQFIGEEPGRARPIEVDGVECGEAKEVLCKSSLSWKELVSCKPLPPRWFVSHWWGEPVFTFVQCCEEHARLRHLSDEDASYWVCAYANRQNDVAQDIAENPEYSSFRKAMLVADGVLLVLDPQAVPFRRIWCSFELYKTFSEGQKRLDIVTVHEGTPRLLSDGLLPGEESWQKKLREIPFPISLLAHGLHRRLEDGEASMEIDKVRILNCMTKRVKTLDDRGVLQRLREGCGPDMVYYNRVNNAMNSHLALAAWPQAVKGNLVRDFDKSKPGSLTLPKILSRDNELDDIQLDFQTFEEVTDAELRSLGEGLPPHLKVLELNFAKCPQITYKGLASLTDRFPKSLEKLRLNLAKCEQIDDPGVEAIARRLPTAARYIALSFDQCSAVSDQGLEAIARRLPELVKHLELHLRGCGISDIGLKVLAERLPQHLDTLELDIEGCRLVTAHGLCTLGQGLPKAVAHVSVAARGGFNVGRTYNSVAELLALGQTDLE